MKNNKEIFMLIGVLVVAYTLVTVLSTVLKVEFPKHFETFATILLGILGTAYNNTKGEQQ